MLDVALEYFTSVIKAIACQFTTLLFSKQPYLKDLQIDRTLVHLHAFNKKLTSNDIKGKNKRPVFSQRTQIEFAYHI